MRLRRRVPVLLAVLVVAAAVFAVVQLRRRAPPEAARLLPGADGFFYVNLKWLRTLKAIGQLPLVPHDPDYEQFIQETGFQFERDLDEAAFAVHYPASWGNGATGGSGSQARFSEVFVGKIQSQRLNAYLHKIARAVENYHSADIYSIPLEGRTVRVAMLNVDSVAVSNHDDPAVIRGIVDRSHKLASPFAGPALLRQYYKSLPVVSKTLPVVKLAWFIGRIQPSRELGSWSMLFQKPSPVVVSAYYPVYSSSLHVRAEAFSENEDDAQGLTDKVSRFLSLFHAAETSVATQGTDPDVKAFFESLSVQRQGDRAVLTASIPPGFLRKVVEESPPELPAALPSAARQPKPGTSPPSQPNKDHKMQD
ncbi:MAG TPA: hypothetical protein VE083_06290 [Terriglobales bacterium]|nr:hypothetical protein [Terriglobales bacterium]